MGILSSPQGVFNNLNIIKHDHAFLFFIFVVNIIIIKSKIHLQIS